MSARPCSICAKGVSLARYVDASPDLTAAALSRQAETVGMNISAARILTHRGHRKAEEPSRIAKTVKDFAVLVRDKAVEQFEADDLTLTDKDTVPGITAGLRAQGILDARARTQQKSGMAEIGRALLDLLSGRVSQPLALDDGLTIDGEAEEIEDDDGTEAG